MPLHRPGLSTQYHDSELRAKRPKLRASIAGATLVGSTEIIPVVAPQAIVDNNLSEPKPGEPSND